MLYKIRKNIQLSLIDSPRVFTDLIGYKTNSNLTLIESLWTPEQPAVESGLKEWTGD